MKKGETVQHIVTERKKLAQLEYKRRHDYVANFVHWKLCEKFHLDRSDKCYEHAPEGSVENENVKLLWDINIQCENIIEARRPHIVLVEKKEKRCSVFDIAVPADVRCSEKEIEKVEKYQDLKREIGRIWQMRSVNVVHVVIGALGSVTKKFEKWSEKLQVDANIGVEQKITLLGTARILRRVLDQ